MTGRVRGISRVLVGTDGSERAGEAARQGARLASILDATLDLVFVVDSHRAHDTDLEAEAEASLERAAALARRSDVEVEGRIVAGDPHDVLVSEVQAHAVDLLCVGPDSGVLGGAIRFGHVARHVLREAPSSVMIARSADARFPSKITCGVDGSEASFDTASLAATISAASEAELHLLHVVPVFRGRDSEWSLAGSDESPPELESAERAATALGVTPARDMAMGRPEHALVAAVRREGADLLVVGHRRVRGVSRVLLGSVSEHCAEHAPSSVIVARS